VVGGVKANSLKECQDEEGKGKLGEPITGKGRQIPVKKGNLGSRGPRRLFSQYKNVVKQRDREGGRQHLRCAGQDEEHKREDQFSEIWANERKEAAEVAHAVWPEAAILGFHRRRVNGLRGIMD